MLALIQEAANQGPDWLVVTRTAAQAAQGIVTALGILIGGIFAYYKFFRQGEHDPTLQLTISGVVGTKGGTTYLQARAFAENKGKVSVKMEGATAALQVSTRKKGDGDWTLRATERVFSMQGHIQPGETLADQVWREIADDDEVAIKMDLVVISDGATTGWLASEVVNLVERRDNGAVGSEGERSS